MGKAPFILHKFLTFLLFRVNILYIATQTGKPGQHIPMKLRREKQFLEAPKEKNYLHKRLKGGKLIWESVNAMESEVTAKLGVGCAVTICIFMIVNHNKKLRKTVNLLGKQNQDLVGNTFIEDQSNSLIYLYGDEKPRDTSLSEIYFTWNSLSGNFTRDTWPGRPQETARASAREGAAPLGWADSEQGLCETSQLERSPLRLAQLLWSKPTSCTHDRDIGVAVTTGSPLKWKMMGARGACGMSGDAGPEERTQHPPAKGTTTATQAATASLDYDTRGSSKLTIPGTGSHELMVISCRDAGGGVPLALVGRTDSGQLRGQEQQLVEGQQLELVPLGTRWLDTGRELDGLRSEATGGSEYTGPNGKSPPLRGGRGR